jgi:hypothetical protein
MSGTTAVWNLLQGGMEIARILQVAVGKDRKSRNGERGRKRCYVSKAVVLRQYNMYETVNNFPVTSTTLEV